MTRMAVFFCLLFLCLPAPAQNAAAQRSGLERRIVYEASDVDQLPVVNTTAIYKCIDLSFADSLCMHQSSLRVFIRVLVEADGRLSECAVVKSSGEFRFDAEVTRAVSFCADRFTPARRGGQQVACRIVFPVYLRRE